MGKLPNFVPISQNSKITEDNLPNTDAPYECVSASLLMAVIQQLCIREIGGTFTCDYFKDQAYGESYEGGTSAYRYIPLVASLGCTLSPINGTPGQLVGAIHNALDRGIPVIVTIPDTYVPASYGWTHCCCAYADTASTITVLDPYPMPSGVAVTHDDSEWIELLKDNQIWTVEKIQKVEEEMPITIDLTNPEVARHFELASADGSAWRCRDNGKIIKDGMLVFYCSFGNSELCGLTYLGLPQSNEIPMDVEGNTKQFWECGVTFYDPKHKYDTRPGISNPDTRPVYLAHLYSANSPATDPRLAPLQSQVSQLQAQLAALNLQLQTDTVVNPQAIQMLQAKLAQIKAIVS